MPLNTIPPNTDFTTAASQALFKTALTSLLNLIRTKAANLDGDAMLGPLEYAAEATVASATTCDVGAATSNRVQITGTTTITGLGTGINKTRLVRFAGALTLTHNATSLILPGAANITTAAGDTAIFTSDGSSNWRCLSYQRASGLAVVSTTANTAQLCKAWVNFNGTGTVAIRDQFNVSSITDNGVGDYTVNFTSAMGSSNYSVSAIGLSLTTGDLRNLVNVKGAASTGASLKSTSQLGILSGSAGAASLTDCFDMSASIFSN
jgi:hypothetical protein